MLQLPHPNFFRCCQLLISQYLEVSNLKELHMQGDRHFSCVLLDAEEAACSLQPTSSEKKHRLGSCEYRRASGFHPGTSEKVPRDEPSPEA